MKKFFIVAVGVMISTMLGMTVGAVASEGVSIVDKLFEKANMEQSYKNDQRELEKLAQEEVAFNNLYLFVYQNVKEGPKNAALKEVASRTEYSKNEVEQIVIDGDTKPIVDRYEAHIAETAEQAAEADAAREEAAEKGEAVLEDGDYDEFEEGVIRNELENKIAREEYYVNELTQEYMLNEYSALKSAYDDEYAFQQVNRKLAYEALANEMFMNGDTNDSAGIDLLYDLNLINTVLFIKDIKVPKRDKEDDEEDVDLASEDDGEKDGEEDFVVSLAAEEDETFNNFTCWEDEDLRDALDEYEENPPTGTGIADDGSDSEASVTYDYDIEDVSDEEELETLEDFNNLLSAFDEPAGNWKFELPCNDVFCVVINLVTDKEDPVVDSEDYKKTDNCIACHVKFIKERMEETLSKSLVPSKVSMNWFEDAVCKAAGLYVNLDLNVYTIPRPIVLDPDNEMSEESKKQADQLTQDLEANDRSYSYTTQSDLDCEAILQQSDSTGGGAEISDIASACADAENARQEQIGEIQDEFIFQSQVESSDALYEQMEAKLLVLYYYFDSFQVALQETQKPLSALISKEYCQ